MYSFNHPLLQQEAKNQASKAAKELRSLASEFGGKFFFGEKLTFAKQPTKPIRRFMIPYFIGVANKTNLVVRAFGSSWDYRYDGRKKSHCHFVIWCWNPYGPTDITASVVKKCWRYGVASVSEVKDLDKALHYCYLQHDIEFFKRPFEPRSHKKLIA